MNVPGFSAEISLRNLGGPCQMAATRISAEVLPQAIVRPPDGGPSYEVCRNFGVIDICCASIQSPQGQSYCCGITDHYRNRSYLLGCAPND